MVCLQQHLVKWWKTCGNTTTGCIDAIKLIFHSKIFFLTTSAQNCLTSRTVTFKSTSVNMKLKQQSIKWLKGKPQAPTGSILSSTFTAGPLLSMKLVIDMLRELFSTQLIKPQIKTGYLTLIHKKGPKNQITYYRPISLLNYDLKIFSKCLTNRLKPLIADLSQEHQYAKPGKQISSMTILLRDL